MTEQVGIKILRHIKFRGIDDFNRPVYKVIEGNYYVGSLDTLFKYSDTKDKINDYFREHLNELVYFGEHYNEEPDGRPLKKDIQLILLE